MSARGGGRHWWNGSNKLIMKAPIPAQGQPVPTDGTLGSTAVEFNYHEVVRLTGDDTVMYDPSFGLLIQQTAAHPAAVEDQYDDLYIIGIDRGTKGLITQAQLQSNHSLVTWW